MMTVLAPNALAMPPAPSSDRRLAPEAQTEDASSSQAAVLNQATLSAILSLAASGGPPKGALPPPSQPSPAHARPGPVRVAVWDEENQVKISGASAPTEENLAAYLAASLAASAARLR